ncbi:MAG: response regulator transcription factor [Lentisphaerae bacterium]|nr:response regulator transcription factor [Lentisphaerota bacterium]
MTNAERKDEKQHGTVPCDRGRVLIVDDEPVVRQVFEVILSADLPEMTFEKAENGEEAVRCFSQGHHALVLMDLRMPVMDGRSAFLEIERLCREKDWEMPSVVFCTGYAPPDSVLQTVSGDASHTLLRKPIGNDELVFAVKSRLAS